MPLPFFLDEATGKDPVNTPFAILTVVSFDLMWARSGEREHPPGR